MSPAKVQFTVFTKPWTMPLPELGKFVKGLGLDGIELPVRPGFQVTPDTAAKKLPEAARMLAGEGVRIGSVAGPADKATIAACAEAGVGVVRRATGGLAVLHGADLTYAVAAPEALLPAGLRPTYEALGAALLAALRVLGVDAQRSAAASAGAGPGGFDCFAEPVADELCVGGRKLVGSAQRRGAGGVLQHGSLRLAGLGIELAAIGFDAPECVKPARQTGRMQQRSGCGQTALDHVPSRVVGRALDGPIVVLQNVGADLRRPHILMPKLLLDATDVRTLLKQTRGKGVPKAVQPCVFVDAGVLLGSANGSLDRRSVGMVPSPGAWPVNF